MKPLFTLAQLKVICKRLWTPTVLILAFLWKPAGRFCWRWGGLFQSGAIHWAVFGISLNLLYWSARLAICAHWLPVHHLPLEPGALRSAANSISFGVSLFWGTLIPPGVGCALLLAGALLGLWGLDTGSTTAKMAAMFIAAGYFAYSGAMLCIQADDHITGVPLLISGMLGGGCVVRLAALLPHDLIIVEKGIEATRQMGLSFPLGWRARLSLKTLNFLRVHQIPKSLP